MALRLEMAIGKPNAAHWLRLQNAFDIWQTRQRSAEIQVIPFKVCDAIKKAKYHLLLKNQLQMIKITIQSKN